MPPVFECVRAGEKTLAYLFRAGHFPAKTTFVTPEDEVFQAGHIVYSAGEEISRHEHLSHRREIHGTAEALVVQKGRCELDLYDEEHQLVATRELSQGDIVLLVGGGHGFRLLEDTVFLEIKQGPYLGLAEKRHF